MKNSILYSIEKAEELSGLGTETIKKFIELEAVIAENFFQIGETCGRYH